MIVQDFCLEKIGWDVKVFYAVTGYYIQEILQALRNAGCEGEYLDYAYRQMFNFQLDTGLTYSNPELRQSVMVIALTSTPQEFANSLQHEQRHLERHICQALGISPYSEDASYLAGEINASMFRYTKRFLCECCRDNLPGKKRDQKTGLFSKPEKYLAAVRRLPKRNAQYDRYSNTPR